MIEENPNANILCLKPVAIDVAGKSEPRCYESQRKRSFSNARVRVYRRTLASALTHFEEKSAHSSPEVYYYNGDESRY